MVQKILLILLLFICSGLITYYILYRKGKAKIYRRTFSEQVIFILVFGAFIIYSIGLIYPFIWAFISSLKTPAEYMMSPFDLPKKLLFSNYMKALEELKANDVTYLEMMWNSCWFTFGGLFIGLFGLSTFSYAMAKYNFKLKGLMYTLNYIFMLLPSMGSLASSYKLYNIYGITNSPLFLITSIGGLGGGFLIMESFYKNLSWSYAEAAFIDGASDFTVFIKIMLPMSVAPLMVMCITSFIARWNNYLTPLLFLDDMPTLATGLFTYRSISVDRHGTYPTFFAGTLMAMIPIFVIYTMFHNTLMDNMLGGGIKE